MTMDERTGSLANLRLWNSLGKTDPKMTKKFTRSGGFSGTAIKPMWCNQRMTEHFGPCGIGWGSGEPKFEVVRTEEEILVFCTVSLWYKESASDALPATVYGVGGDKVVLKQSSGLRASDEAFKAAFTDALGNAMKFIGVAADIHMGLFDDSKYVREMEQEFSGEKKQEVIHVDVISSADAAAFRKACTDSGHSRDDVKRALREFKRPGCLDGIQSSAQIPQVYLKEWMEWANNTAELPE